MRRAHPFGGIFLLATTLLIGPPVADNPRFIFHSNGANPTWMTERNRAQSHRFFLSYRFVL